MLPSETMIWQPEFTDKTLSRKPGAVQISACLSTYHFTAIKPCAQHGIFCLESFPKLTDMVTI
ncbi:hypothetical protein EH270_23265 [Escherichia coli]|nr:hypothetical protein [Escherichia coli]